jgi:glycosyltransferase involved in cell wall biosynthesis
MPVSNGEARKRVVLFSHASNLSGAPIALVQLARCLPLSGWHPLVLLPESGPLESQLKASNIDYEVLAGPLKLLDFVRKIRRADPAVIHVNSLVKTWPVLVSRLLKKPVIWHVHEYLDDKRLYAGVIHLIADGVILISREQFSLFKMKPKAIQIPNGVDTERFKAVASAKVIPRESADVRTVVAYIGRIEHNKGFHLLAQAAAKLKSRPWIHYVVVGDAPKRREKYREEILEYIKKERLKGVFHFLGIRKDIPEILASCDILCHPSYSDTFPLVMMEAMASGLAVIGTAVGEVPFIIDDGKTGFVLPPGDQGALADAIKKLDDDAAALKRMGKAGKLKVQKEYELNIHAERISGFYRSVIDRARRRYGRDNR